MKLLVIEDELKIANLLEKGFREQGHEVDVSLAGDDGLTRASSNPSTSIEDDITYSFATNFLP